MKKVIVLGFGSMGKLYCNRIVGGFISEMQLYGIVCRNIQKHPDVYSYGVKVYDSFDQAIQEKECFDAVIITCPHKSHIDYITKAIQNGLEVLCEKPISDSLEEALSLLNQPTELNTKISMIFNWRKRKSIIEIKKRLDILGRINHIVWIANFWYRTDFYHKSSPWRSTWEKEGGGLLINQAQHLIDVWCYLFGLPDRD